MNRAAAASISLALLGAAVSPIVRDPADDGFPLSTYPMFAFARPTEQTIDYAVGETARGERRTLAPSLIGTGEVLQARATLEHAVRGGQSELARLCAEIASRVDDRAIVVVRIVTGTHDALEYLVDHRVGPERERARCAVPR